MLIFFWTVERRFVWLYATIQFVFVVIFAHIFYSVVTIFFFIYIFYSVRVCEEELNAIKNNLVLLNYLLWHYPSIFFFRVTTL